MAATNAIEPKATKAENLEEAKRWLEKALAFEAEGKTGRMMEMCFERACAYELAAFR